MSIIKLSICIPTYNRETYLRNALEDLSCRDFSFSYEIVISDNASTDNTTQVVDEFIEQGLPIRYYRRAVNGGPGPNLTCAFNHAVGKYLVYLADDDYLVPSGIEAAVRYLDSNPDVVACHAPWYLYNEVEDRNLSQFYSVDVDMKFSQQDFAAVFQFIYERHVFPEIAIYRASALRSSWVPREFCFWAFSYLAHFLDQGAVAFLKQPFYRSVVVSKLGVGRQQTGNNDVMTSWDKYRGGLEYFLYVGIKRGKLKDTPEAHATYDRMCKVFMLNRMAVAIRFWAARKDFIKAYELYTRMAFGGMSNHPEVAKLRDGFQVLVSMQTLLFHVNATAQINRLMISGISNSEALSGMLRELGLAAEIHMVTDAEPHDPALLETTAVLASDTSQREKLLELGYKPNLIFTVADLTQHVLV